MLISLNWLNEYLDRPTDTQEVDDILTAAGFPIEGVEEVGGDLAIDIEVTSNRPDMLSHIGVARELAANTDRILKTPEFHLNETGDAVDRLTSVKLDSKACPVYTARVITGVRVGPSPDWMVQRLETLGLRSVNNVVDITNYVLLEMGQPLHVFDMALLKEKRIEVREAVKDEAFTAIDESTHKLAEFMLVIADADKPVAVAGVMGGKDSEVNDQTVDILLESATFAPLSVRKTSRALKLSSDSSYRFERGVDLKGIELASQRAAALIVELAGGTLAKGVIRMGDTEPEAHQVTMRTARCNQLLGTQISDSEMVDYFAQLGLSPELSDGVITCTIPSYRLDLDREVDLIEEVARLYGFETIDIDPKIKLQVKPPQRSVQARQRMGKYLNAHGYFEAINFSNTQIKQSEPFKAELDLVLMPEEKKKKEPALRPSVIPGLLITRKQNQDAAVSNVKLYEVASIFGKQADVYVQGRKLGLIADVDQPSETLRQVRGVIETLLDELGIKGWSFKAMSEPPMWAEVAGQYYSEQGTVLGVIGLINKDTLKRFDLKVSVVGAELDYATLIGAWPRDVAVMEPPKYPAIERDLSVIVKESVAWADIEREVNALKPALMEEVDFVTAYRGKPIENGSKSVSFRITFRDAEKTLRHEEVDGQMEAVMTSLSEKLKAEIRTQ